MKVGDSFTTVRTVVDGETVAGLAKAFLRSDDWDAGEEVAEEGCVLLVSFTNSGDGLFRNQQKVDRSLRLDITETENLVILKDNVGGNLT